MLDIRSFREKAGMTQTELAVNLGVTQAAIAMWETGERKPNIIMLKRIANIFGCTVDDMLATVSTDGGDVDD